MSELSWLELYRIAGELLMRVHEFIGCGSLNLEYEQPLNGFVYRWASTQGTKQAKHVVSIKELSLYRGSLSRFALLIAETMNDGTVPSRDSSMTEPDFKRADDEPKRHHRDSSINEHGKQDLFE